MPTNVHDHHAAADQRLLAHAKLAGARVVADAILQGYWLGDSEVLDQLALLVAAASEHQRCAERLAAA